MDNLYVHLQSDSSPEFFPNNTISDFRNQLAGPLDLDPEFYEVALVQCSYVYNPPCIKAGKEIAQLHVLGPVMDFCDTVQRSEQIFSVDLADNLLLVDQNIFMLTGDNFAHYQMKTSDNINKFTDLGSDTKKTLDIHRLTEHVIECRLGRTVENFDELLSYVNEKLIHYQSRIMYKKDANQNLIREFHNNVRSIEFDGTYDGIFNRNMPYAYFNANKINVLPGSVIFRLKVTIKIEHLGRTNHSHDFPIDLDRFETKELLVPASKYYENNTKGSLKVHVYTYQIKLVEDVYDVEGLIDELTQKIPSPLFYYGNNLVSLSYIDNSFDFVTFNPSDQVKAVLGISEITTTQTTQNDHREEKGVFRPFFGYGQQKMYIYADIIENQFIGSQLAPLLRITDYKGQNATTSTQEFAHHHYVPLRKINLDQIHMYIRSETSDYLPIELGTFSATLHFRRKRF